MSSHKAKAQKTSRLACISNWQPIAFVCANVEKLLQKHIQTFKFSILALGDIQDDAQRPLHNVTYQVLNTPDFGIRQNRRRVYVVGWQRTTQASHFEWPIPHHIAHSQPAKCYQRMPGCKHRIPQDPLGKPFSIPGEAQRQTCE